MANEKKTELTTEQKRRAARKWEPAEGALPGHVLRDGFRKTLGTIWKANDKWWAMLDPKGPTVHRAFGPFEDVTAAKKALEEVA